MLSVHFQVLLVSGDELLGRVDHDTHVSMLSRVLWVIHWSMLASDVHRDHLCHTTKGKSRCIEEMPCVTFVLYGYIIALRLIVRYVSLQSSVDDLTVH